MLRINILTGEIFMHQGSQLIGFGMMLFFITIPQHLWQGRNFFGTHGCNQRLSQWGKLVSLPG